MLPGMAVPLTHNREQEMKIRRAFQLLFVTSSMLACGVARVRAQTPSAHPDFSGDWVFDAGKSDDGPLAPLAMIHHVEQSATGMKVTSDVETQQGSTHASSTYGFDGKVWMNSQVLGGAPVQVSTIVTWQGTSLVFDKKLPMGENEVHQVDAWTLDADGRTLHIDRKVEVQGHSLSARLTMLRK
jgi:hypothetical protein